MGSEYVTDFIIQKADSSYIVVEIEKASNKLYTINGDQTKELRHAIRQIEDWQRWIHENISYARKKLKGITNPKGLILIGNSRTLNDDDLKRLSYSNSNTRRSYEIITYDDLIEKGKLLIKNLS